MDNKFTPIIQTRQQKAKEKTSVTNEQSHSGPKNDKKEVCSQTDIHIQTTSDHTNNEVMQCLKSILDGQTNMFRMIEDLILLKPKFGKNKTDYQTNPTSSEYPAQEIDLNIELKKTIQEMKTTIEVLNIENLSLKKVLTSNSTVSNEWKIPNKTTRISTVKDQPFLLSTKNRYEIFSKQEIQEERSTTEDLYKLPTPAKPYRNRQIHKSNKKPFNNNLINRDKLEEQLPDLHLFADSHGRGLADLVQTKLPKTKVSSMFKPGAKLSKVIPECQYLKQGQFVFLMAGTNDIAVGEHDRLVKALPTTLDYLSKYYVILSTIPLRHDLDTNHPVNEDIMYVNAYLKELIHYKPNVKLLDVSYINRRYFTQHGLHLNYKGKKLISNLLVQTLLTFNQHKTSTEPHHYQEHVTDSPAATSEVTTSTPLAIRQYKSYSEATRPIDSITHSFLVTPPFHNTKLC